VVTRLRTQRGISSPEALSSLMGVDRAVMRRHEDGETLAKLPTVLSLGQVMNLRPGIAIDLWAQLLAAAASHAQPPEGWQTLAGVTASDLASDQPVMDELDAIRWFVDFADAACWTSERAQYLSAWLANLENAESLVALQDLCSRRNAQGCTIGAMLKVVRQLSAKIAPYLDGVALTAAKYLLELMLQRLPGRARSSLWRHMHLSRWLIADPEHNRMFSRMKEQLDIKLYGVFGAHARSE
jgi:hypothetical protein